MGVTGRSSEEGFNYDSIKWMATTYASVLMFSLCVKMQKHSFCIMFNVSQWEASCSHRSTSPYYSKKMRRTGVSTEVSGEPLHSNPSIHYSLCNFYPQFPYSWESGQGSSLIQPVINHSTLSLNVLVVFMLQHQIIIKGRIFMPRHKRYN